MAARTAASLTSRARTCSATMRWRSWAQDSAGAGAAAGGGGADMAASRLVAARAGRRPARPGALPAIADPAGHRRQADGDDRPLLQEIGGLGDHQEVLDEPSLGDDHLTAHPQLVEEQL